MKNEYTCWQRAAPVHSRGDEIADEPGPAYMHLPAKGRSVMLTCDIGIEIAQTFGGPV